MNRFEIHHGGVASDVEEVFSASEVARAVALTLAEVRESVFDGDTLALSGTPLLRRGHPTEALLEFFLRVDLHAAPTPTRSVRTARTQFTG